MSGSKNVSTTRLWPITPKLSRLDPEDLSVPTTAAPCLDQEGELDKAPAEADHARPNRPQRLLLLLARGGVWFEKSEYEGR